MNCRSLNKLLLVTVAAISFTDVKSGSTPEPALVINEIMPANVDMFLDPSFNYGNWIELYNPSADDIDISGWYLSNDTLDNRQCPLGESSRIVPAGGFLTLWVGHFDDYCQQQIDGFDFKYENATVILSDANGNAVSRVDYKSVPARISYARKSDGANEWGLTGTPTPESTNQGSAFADLQLNAPVIDVDSKLFTEQFNINITIPDGATLQYTEDGSTPLAGNPSVKTSSGTHTVNSTKIFRFRLYKEGMLPSPVVTRSYIRTSNEYSIPVVSIATANDNLYSVEYGLWKRGPNGKPGYGQTDKCNWNRSWDRPVNIEIIGADGSIIINQEVDITPSGRYSRAWDPRPFKIMAKKKFGYGNYFAFTPFADKPYNKYKTIKLRGGGNNHSSRLKDAALQEIILRSGLDVDCQSYQPVHHYINGVYYGVINMREPNNKDYAYSNYGIDEDEVDCFKLEHSNGGGGFTLTEGSRDTWDEWVSLSKTAADESSYQRICEIIDVDEYANYMAIELFLFNRDWPKNNIKGFRHNPDGRFRFVVFDLDQSFGSVDNATNDNPFTVFDSEEYYSADDANAGAYKSVMVTIFRGMLKNSTFRKKFIDSFCIVAGSVFDPDFVAVTVDELEERARTEMAFNRESPTADAELIKKTINANYKNVRLNQLVSWPKANLTGVKKIPRNIHANISQAVLTLNGQKIPNASFSGSLFIPATVKATAPVGYKFIGWINNYGTMVSTDSEYDLNKPSTTITAYFAADDQIERPVRINEISADNGIFINDAFKKNDWIELYNTTQYPVNMSGMYLSDDIDNPHKYTLPDTVIECGEYLVIWCDNESGPQLHAPFKLANKNGNVVILTAHDDSWADTLTYKAHSKFQSIGLYPDGGNRSFVMNLPSIGKPNKLSSYDNLDRDWITGVRKLLEKSDDGATYDLLGEPVSTMESGKLYIRNGRVFYYHP